MLVTRETDYAVRCILHLAVNYAKIVDIEAIAEAKHIPKSFLAKILQKLSKCGIVISHRGAAGGFQLARPPEQISLLDVIECIQEEVMVNMCAVEYEFCELSAQCAVHPIWVEMRNDLVEMLRKRNFKDLAEKDAATLTANK